MDWRGPRRDTLTIMSDATSPGSGAEQTDPSVLGESVGGTDRPGDDYPPAEPLGVDDPSILADGSIAEDDVESRSDREEPEVSAERPTPAPDRVHDLLDPNDDPDRLDDEPQMIASEDDDGDSSPEVSAIHVTGNDGAR